MFNIGGSEMVVLGILALLVFGPEGLPGIIKNVMRTINAVKAAARDFQTEVSSALEVENERQDLAKRRRKPNPYRDKENVIDPGPAPEVPPLPEELVKPEEEQTPEADSVDAAESVAPVEAETEAKAVTEEEPDDDGPRVPMRPAPRRASKEKVAEPS
ncbi:MAG: twin-arginine translocase TatA/TatE family subunit [Vulcanimicrobiota bacterium]